jgi:hypothetical protein
VRSQALPVAAPSGPYGELVLNPQVLDRYAYARDNPLRYTDGRRSEGCCRRRRRRVAALETARAGKGSTQEAGARVGGAGEPRVLWSGAGVWAGKGLLEAEAGGCDE